jgi:hypothetical protein
VVDVWRQEELAAAIRVSTDLEATVGQVRAEVDWPGSGWQLVPDITATLSLIRQLSLADVTICVCVCMCVYVSVCVCVDLCVLCACVCVSVCALVCACVRVCMFMVRAS